MTKTKINKIYMQNYKLFECLELDLTNDLNIFDGPNGYGKTSIFDALEFVITGNISRLTNCSVLDGKYTYNGFALAKDQNKDVIIKAEIVTEQEKCTIFKRIKVGIGNNNPKKLTEITETYVFPDYNIVDLESENRLSEDECIQMQEKYFGKHSQTLYNLLYYVQQEDRLQYLKQNEKSRVEAINSLFQTKDIESKQSRITSSKSKLKNLIKIIDDKIKVIKLEVSEKTENIPGNDSLYNRIFTKSIRWDDENPTLNSKEALYEALSVLKSIKTLIENIDEYKKDNQNKIIQQFIDKTTTEVYEAYMLYYSMGESYEIYLLKRKDLQFINQVLKQAEMREYNKINFEKIEELIDKQKVITQIKSYLLEYQQMMQTGKSAENAVRELFELREKLSAHNKRGVVGEAKCPYCGYDWEDKKIFDIQIENTTKELKSYMGESDKNITIIQENIKKLFEKELKEELKLLKNKWETDKIMIRFLEHDENLLERRYQYVNGFFNKLNINVPQKFDIDKTSENIASLKALINEKVFILSDSYKANDEEYKFQSLIQNYFNTIDDLKDLSIKDIIEKGEYLRFRYATAQIELRKKLEELQNKKEILEKQVAKALLQFEKDVKSAKAQFIGNIVATIEIPFYLYSARLLQSYQAGQGIIIRENSTDKFTNIRFTIPGGEHDVLYTMSSGQLSGILLSYFLVLNKTFSKDGLGTLLIDDPVQCMDDINIISFVELIKTEFQESQIVISTHENSFANYISYKYKKYGRHSIRYNLKEITNVNL